MSSRGKKRHRVVQGATRDPQQSERQIISEDAIVLQRKNQWIQEGMKMSVQGSINVDLEEIRSALETVFDHLKKNGVTTIEIEEDYYWNVPQEDVYNPLVDPTDLDLGQLTDDWSRLQSIRTGEDPVVGYALVWASSLLRRIGELNVY